MTARAGVVVLGAVLVLAGCGHNATRTVDVASTSTSAPGSAGTPTIGVHATGGDFCTPLRALVGWQLANADQATAPAFLAENARRYAALEAVAPAAYRAAIAFFARYAAEPPSSAAQETGFADQAHTLTRAISSCHIDVAHP